MARHVARIVIDRPVADVWAFVSDLASTPKWRTSVTDVEPGVELAVGNEFGATTKVLGRQWRWRLRLTAVEHEARLAYEVSEGVTDIRVEYRLEPTDAGGCRFTLAGESRPTNLLTRVLDRPAAWQLRREIAKQLSKLKDLMETATG